MDSSESSGDAPPARDGNRKGPRTRKSAPKDDAALSKVLQSVYQSAVKEDIPSEMLDLLSKLD